MRAAVGAGDHDAVIFTGAGATSAINKLCAALCVRELAAEARMATTGAVSGAAVHSRGGPVVIVGPWEHHSNICCWRDAGATVLRATECVDGSGVDLGALTALLASDTCRQAGLVVGTFSAASNITGQLADVDAITETLHRGNALAVWDYATAAPYVDIQMNPVSDLARKDAIFISTHKFLGGINTPGILVRCWLKPRDVHVILFFSPLFFIAQATWCAFIVCVTAVTTKPVSTT